MLTLKNLTFSYLKGEPVVKNISATFSKGNVYVLLGGNGSGKSTLLSLMLGWLTPDSGSITVNGKEIALFSKRELSQKIAIVTQSERIPFHFTVIDFLLLARTPYLPPLSLPSLQERERAIHYLSKFGIESFAERRIDKLSGGEFQMVALIRAVLQEPSLLLLDEPTSHLDPSNVQLVSQLLGELKREGVTIVVAMHDYILAQIVADQLLLLSSGSVVASGERERVLTQKSFQQVYNTPFIETTALKQPLLIPKDPLLGL